MPVPNNIPLPGTIGNVDDTKSPYSPFGPPSSNTQFITGGEGTFTDELARNIKPVSTIRSQDNDVDVVQNKNYGGVGPTLAYPLENSNPAYQARVTFTMKTFAPKVDGKNQKNFSSMAKDNLKFVAKSDDVVRTETMESGIGFDPFLDQSDDEDYSNIDDVINADAAGSNATLTGKLDSLYGKGMKFVDKLTASEFAQISSNVVLGGLKEQLVPGEPVIDMYFPLTMQFNDNAQYDNAELGAIGASAEALVRSGAGALASVVGAANQGVESIFDLMKGNKQLTEAALRVGAARAIDLGSFLNSGVANALRLTNRAIVNPNVRALFKGVSLREFTFQFKMIPESQQEAAIAQQIVKHFRRNMYPSTFPVNINDAVSADLGYQFPNLFQINFKYKGGENLRIPRMQLCYLRNVSTTVNPTGGTFRRDGQPNEIDLTLSFVEYRTLNKKDIKDGF
tara:strand:+ start:47 stop:1402 length:1356 start_codon:yes stop_codon:yes gene_type:complete